MTIGADRFASATSRKRLAAIRCLGELREPRFEKTLWGPWALLRAGAFTYNRTQDPRQANPYYEEMLRKYPDHPEADLATVFLFENLVRMKDWAYAQRMGLEMQRRYPGNEWSEAISKKLKQCDEALAQAGRQQG